jgi:hypothetical protein
METAGIVGFVLFMLLTLYMIIHMVYNRFNGKDDLDNLFLFWRLIKKNKK